MRTHNNPDTIDGYIATFPGHIQKILEELRSTIKKAAPDAEEKISYQMPAFTMKGILVYFAAHKNHIGFYPTASAVAAFRKELTEYNNSRGTIQFPLDKPLPISLVTKIVRFRVKENLEKADSKAKKVKPPIENKRSLK